jgi:hypothetical protein
MISMNHRSVLAILSFLFLSAGCAGASYEEANAESESIAKSASALSPWSGFQHWPSGTAGCARAIGGPDWVIGCDTTPGGDGGVYQLRPTLGPQGAPLWFWRQTNPWDFARSISVSPENVPWVANSLGQIYRYNGAAFVWRAGECAREVAAGPNETVWAIGCNQQASGDFDVYRLNSAGHTTISDAFATAIAVSPEGRPWVVNAAGGVYRWNGSAFAPMPRLRPLARCFNGARAIAVGPNDQAFALGCAFTPQNGYQIFSWNGSSWDLIPGLATGIAVDRFGKPFVVSASGEIFSGV